jgi:hypothetical protein
MRRTTTHRPLPDLTDKICPGVRTIALLAASAQFDVSPATAYEKVTIEKTAASKPACTEPRAGDDIDIAIPH